MKKVNTQTVELDDEVEFDGKKVKIIKFDLFHINQGWDDKSHDYHPPGVVRNTNITAQDVVDYFEQFGYFQPEWEKDVNKEEVIIKGNKHFRYVAIVTDFDDDNNQKKIVIDIPENFKGEGIVVTIY